MHSKSIKLFIFILFCAVFALCALDGARTRANANRPPSRNTGGPGESNCTSCHDGTAVNSGTGTVALNGLPANYMPNQAIPLTVVMTQAGRSKFGFQVTAIDDTGKQAGTIVATDSARTTLTTGTVAGNTRQYIGQTASGTASGTYAFTWNAPAMAVGRVTFYVTGMAANGDGDTPGDSTYTINRATMPGSAVAALANTSAASYVANGSLTNQSIAAAWGTGLTQNSVRATALPLPTVLDGAEVKVKDSANTERSAGLFFVSPGQINYLVPDGTATGAATVTVLRNGALVAQGSATIDTIAPAFFSANADGKGAPAAVILRLRGGAATFEPIVQMNAQTQKFDPLPIDLGPATDQVYLILFGSGFRGATQSAVSATIGGAASSVLFAGPQSMLAGLDQANILIPRSLIGRGLVDVAFSAAGKAGNTLQINVK
jgi:uncharacterized protein (TIGR03437 family)